MSGNRMSVEEEIRPVSTKDPISVTATFNGDAVDAVGFKSAQAVLTVGLSGSTLSATRAWVFHVEDSPESSVWTDVPDAQIIDADAVGTATNSFGAIDAMTEDNAIYTMGIRDFARYLRVVGTLTGTASDGIVLSALFNLGWTDFAAVDNDRNP